eukprot:1461786-Pleurochrysis_carterae.AAC.3
MAFQLRVQWYIVHIQRRSARSKVEDLYWARKGLVAAGAARMDSDIWKSPGQRHALSVSPALLHACMRECREKWRFEDAGECKNRRSVTTPAACLNCYGTTKHCRAPSPVFSSVNHVLRHIFLIAVVPLGATCTSILISPPDAVLS